MKEPFGSFRDPRNAPSESPDPEPGVPGRRYPGRLGTRPRYHECSRGITSAPALPTGAGDPIREVGIRLCLKESDGSEAEKYQKDYTLRPRCLTFLKAQLDSDLPEAASGIRTRLCSPVTRVRQLRAAPGCAGFRIRPLRGCLGRPPWTLVGPPKWLCFRYLVRVFFLGHVFPRGEPVGGGSSA